LIGFFVKICFFEKGSDERVLEGHGEVAGGEGKIDNFGDYRNENRGTVFQKRGGDRIEFALLVGKRV